MNMTTSFADDATVGQSAAGSPFSEDFYKKWLRQQRDRVDEISKRVISTLDPLTEIISRQRDTYEVTVGKATRAAIPLAEWEGEVRSFDGGKMNAALKGIFGTGVIGQFHDAEIPIEEVPVFERQFIENGAAFRFTVSYVTERGTAQRMSKIAFRRHPLYQTEKIERAQRLARELSSGLRLE